MPSIQPSRRARRRVVEVGGREPQRRRARPRPSRGRLLRPGRRRSPRRLGGLEPRDGEQVVASSPHGPPPPAPSAGRKTPAIAPRIRPMPSEKKRVIWSAPTYACQWRSASSRRNVPRLISSRSAARPRSYERSRDPTQRLDVDRFVVGVIGDPVEGCAEPGKRSGERPGGQLRPRIALGAEAADLVHDRWIEPGTRRSPAGSRSPS